MMSEYAGARSPSSQRDYPQVQVPAKGFYTMGLASFSKPENVTDRCQNCKGSGTYDNAPCIKCNGAKYTTRKVIRLKYESQDGFAEEDMTFKISDEWVVKGSGRTVSASTFFLRLRDFTGIDDPDLLDKIIQDDHQRNGLIGTLCEVTIIPNKTGKYLRIAGVECKAPTRIAQPTRSGNGGLQPMAETVEQVRQSLGPASTVPDLTLDDIKQAYLDSGRSELEFRAFLVARLGASKTVTKDQKIHLMKAVKALPFVGAAHIEAAAEQAGLELEDGAETVPF